MILIVIGLGIVGGTLLVSGLGLILWAAFDTIRSIFD